MPREEVSSDSKTWALCAHLSWLVAGFVGPLVVWLVKREEDPFVEKHGREALNFQITLTGASLLCVGLTFVTCGFGAFVAIPAMLVLTVAGIVVSIQAALAASDGRTYRYPGIVRFVKSERTRRRNSRLKTPRHDSKQEDRHGGG